MVAAVAMLSPQMAANAPHPATVEIANPPGMAPNHLYAPL